MKKLLLILLIIGAAGCDEFREHVETANAEPQNSSGMFQNGIAQYVVIDSCEYYELQFHGAEYCTHYNLIHKGNCKNCRKFYKELLKVRL
jgi:hypothetical protein